MTFIPSKMITVERWVTRPQFSVALIGLQYAIEIERVNTIPQWLEVIKWKCL